MRLLENDHLTKTIYLSADCFGHFFIVLLAFFGVKILNYDILLMTDLFMPLQGASGHCLWTEASSSKEKTWRQDRPSEQVGNWKSASVVNGTSRTASWRKRLPTSRLSTRPLIRRSRSRGRSAIWTCGVACWRVVTLLKSTRIVPSPTAVMWWNGWTSGSGQGEGWSCAGRRVCLVSLARGQNTHWTARQSLVFQGLI